MSKLADIIEENRAFLLQRQQDLRQELSEIALELAAVEAYDRAKRQRPEAPENRRRKGRPPGSGKYPTPGDGTLSIEEAGEQFLGLKHAASWAAWRKGEIPSVKVGRFRRVPLDEMRRRMAQRQQPNGPREEEGYPGSLASAGR